MERSRSKRKHYYDQDYDSQTLHITKPRYQAEAPPDASQNLLKPPLQSPSSSAYSAPTIRPAASSTSPAASSRPSGRTPGRVSMFTLSLKGR
ncbi:hypothetical protein AAC387_Pa07g1948 [Persea americana]